jgi:hypothetical protein
MEIRYARLSAANTPEPCSRSGWLVNQDNRRHNPLARLSLKGYAVKVAFTGQWDGPEDKPPCFFTVSVSHPFPTCDEWHFETFEQAASALPSILEEVIVGFEGKTAEGTAVRLGKHAALRYKS